MKLIANVAGILAAIVLTLDIAQAQNTFPSSGNVGIGTTTPSYQLDVVQSGADCVIHSSVTSGSKSACLYLGTDVSQTAGDIFEGGSTYGFWGGANSLNLLNLAGGPTVFYTGTSATLYIASNGHVGIGTTNPTQQLSVKGTIQAYEVIVDASWSDYVFDKNYRLTSLGDVEQYIAKEHHLPGIPSAQEVAARGVSVGSIESKLLAKIEELTLHQIEQEKRLQALERENEALRKKSL